MKTKTYDILKREFARIVTDNALEGEVTIRAAVLSPEEALGNPEDKDYPLIVGKERMMQAEFRGSLGQAFTDMFGNFSGRLSEIAPMELTDNFRRAIFISSLNAVMRYLGLINKTTHCKNDEPRLCCYELARHIEENYGRPRVAMVGLQPRMVEVLSKRFQLRVTDMDQANIGTEKFGCTIHGPEMTGEHLEWCDVALVTGTTIVNNTIDRFMISRPVIWYGVTISGAAKLLGLDHFCYLGH
ncbi:MAG: DUF364 domain-containing protein [Dehalococcoidia bacterium]